MGIPELDYVSMQEAVRKFDTSIEELQELIKAGYLTAYVPVPLAHRIFAEAPQHQYAKASGRMWWDDYTLKFGEVEILSLEGKTYKTASGHYACGAKELRVSPKEFRELKDGQSDQKGPNDKKSDFDMGQYIKLNKGIISDDEIIYELRERGFQNNRIGVALGGTYRKGSNALAVKISRKYNKYKKKLGT